MSLVDLSDAQDRVGTGITQDQLDEIEEDLAVLIGPLIGERTETFLLYEANAPRWNIDGLWLSRRTNAVILTNASFGEASSVLTAGTDYRLVNGLLIELVRNGTAWLDIVTATYEPNDEESVRSVIYDMLAFRQTPAGIQSIRIGAFSETYFPGGSDAEVVIGSLIGKVLPAAGMGLTSPFRYAAARRDRTIITATGS